MRTWWILVALVGCPTPEPEPARDRVEPAENTDIVQAVPPASAPEPDCPDRVRSLAGGPLRLPRHDGAICEGVRRALEAMPSAWRAVLLLAGLADVLEVRAPTGPDDPALGVAWEALARRIGVADPVPEPGDAAVLDALVRFVARELYGESPGVEDHVLRAIAQSRLIEASHYEGLLLDPWASVSGWSTERGLANGLEMKEQDRLVALRIALGGDHGPTAVFRPRAGARFVSKLAAVDPRQDYAETLRLAVTRPEEVEVTGTLTIRDGAGPIRVEDSGEVDIVEDTAGDVDID